MKRRNLLKTFSLSALVGGMSSWVSNLAHAQDKTSVTASATAGPELPQKIQRIAFASWREAKP